MRTLVEERQVGTRTILGTDWPVVDQVHRIELGGLVEWIVTRGVCNGSAESGRGYKTRREALEALGSDTLFLAERGGGDK